MTDLQSRIKSSPKLSKFEGDFAEFMVKMGKISKSCTNTRSKHPSMGRKMNRAYLVIALCGILGVIVGGTASRAELNQCQAAEMPADSCLTQDPVIETVEGMGAGLVAGAGAAVGATWQQWRRDT